MTWYAGNNSTNGGNNTGWVFTAPSGGVNYSLTCSVGTYSYTGRTATFTYVAGRINYSLTCAVGSYAVTGKAATLTYVSNGKVNYSLSCSTGSYTVTGQNATLTYISNAIAPTGRGGFKKQKKVFKDNRKEVELDIANAIDKIIGTKKPEILIAAKPEKQDKIFESDNLEHEVQTQKLQEIAMKAQALALQAEIDRLIQAELDDEESLMLLL